MWTQIRLAPIGAVRSGSTLFVKEALPSSLLQTFQQMHFVVIGVLRISNIFPDTFHKDV